MSTRMTIRLSDESAAFIDALVAANQGSRASTLDRIVRREMRRQRAREDAAIYAGQGEDPDLAEWVGASLATPRPGELD